MKTIFTLLASLAIAQSNVNAQTTINETLESTTSLAELTSNCWTVSGVGFSTASRLNGNNSFEVLPTTSGANSGNSNQSNITTPYINIIAGTSLTFNYKLSNALSQQGIRTITASLLDINGISTPAGEVVLTKNNSNGSTIYQFTIAFTTSSIQKLVLNIVGSGDGNSYLYIDDFIYASTFNYSAQYSCDAFKQKAPLPIKLISFSGNISSNKAQLQWSVADNETGEQFEIQKSTDGKSFNTTATVFTTNKVGTETYSFRDAAELSGTAYFKLKIKNKDNSVSYSKIITLQPEKGNTAGTLNLVQNPVASTLQFQVTTSAAGNNTVVVYNNAGMKVFSTNVLLQKGNNAVSLNIDNNISSGTYFLEVSNGTERNVAKMIKK